ncbi:septal ring lytic transglycosylase RlpA family protein [Spongiibacter sp.]|uniref:septal ring lytic transglycosylase RlpA family protein n=1 Tax=Spongiibacter sp. TaxID=2024860 RepID=UPI000C6828B2|nr:septal ring lytic transglycosylase RlpA family protein [Spongiibacter sp.]MAY39995.1 septal ring lytic transglycosylase RlpA family lipoprotein [Spongiibacter sp.]
MRTLLIVALALLAACSQQPTRVSDSGPVWVPTEKDGAHADILDPNSIADAVPQPEVIRLAGNSNPYTVLGKTYRLVDDHRGFTQRGVASWYGTKFHGQRTANGEVYSLYDMTAAHRSLPIPVYVRVKNLDNGREAVVRVNDRGPFHEDRIIDLSYAAAVKLGFAEKGTAPVEIEVIDTDNIGSKDRAPDAQYYLQVAAFSQLTSAQQLEASLSSGLPYPVMVASQQSAERAIHRVRIGPLPDYPSVQAAKQALRSRWTGEPSLIVDERR